MLPEVRSLLLHDRERSDGRQCATERMSLTRSLSSAEAYMSHGGRHGLREAREQYVPVTTAVLFGKASS